MPAQLIVGVVVEALDRCFLDGSVHPLDLAIGPWMPGFGRAVIDIVPRASILKRMCPEAFAIGHGLFDEGNGRSSAARCGELDAVVGQHSVNLVWYRFDQPEQEVARGCRLGRSEEHT